MGLNFNNLLVKKNMYKGRFGIEKESLRINKDGFLAHTKHPFYNNPYIDRDFCENQIEIVTDICHSTNAVYTKLTELHNTVVNSLNCLDSGREFLWLFSNPPYIKGENDIPIASFKGTLKGKELYRQYLAKKYGKKKMLFSGIHFNFSFDDELINIGFKKFSYSSYREYKDSIYLELAKKFTKYSWLIVYLTAASPIMDGSFFDDTAIGKDIITPYSSARCSEIGYWNDFIPVLKYNTLTNYICSIQKYVDNELLKSVSELYYPIRLKPHGENSLENLESSGVNHIEFRMLDLNPLSPTGIIKDDIDFLHMLIIYLMSLPNEAFTDYEQITAVKNIKNAAKYDDENTVIEFLGEELSVSAAALKILCNMEDFFTKCEQTEAIEIISYQKDKILNKNKRYAEIIRNKFSHNYVKNGVKLSLTYADTI